MLHQDISNDNLDGKTVIHCVSSSSMVPEKYKNGVNEMIAKISNQMNCNNADSTKTWSRNDFQIGAPLGNGSFGRVYLAREVSTHYLVAMKVISLLSNKLNPDQILREIDVSSRLRHPFIVRMFTYFSDAKRIYIISELAGGGQLYKYVKNQPNGRLSESKAAKFIYEIATAIEYCHRNGVIHRDLKLENVLLTYDFRHIKLADFGSAVLFSSDDVCKRRTLCGTIDYLSPELIEGKEYDEKIDIWCIGIICYELIVGCEPFKGKKQMIVENKIKLIDIVYPSFVSSEAKDLINDLLQYEPKNRLHPHLIKKHLFIRKYIDL